MSVQMNQYLCYGYMLPYKESEKALEAKYTEDKIEEIFDEYHDSAFKKEIQEVNGCSLISDGMNGKYNFFGKIYQKSKVYEPLDTTTMPKVTAKVKKMIEEQMLELFGSDLNVKPAVVLLTHYR